MESPTPLSFQQLAQELLFNAKTGKPTQELEDQLKDASFSELVDSLKDDIVKMAFWINAYNAHTVYIILTKYPVSSILKIDGGKVWTTRKLKIAGISITLSDIE